MKIKVTEYGRCFSLDIEPEDMKEAAMLTRMSTNVTNQLRLCETYAHTDGTFTSSVVIGKRKNVTSTVQLARH